MLRAEFNFSFQRFITIIFGKICDLCKTFLIAYIYLIIICAIEHKLHKLKRFRPPQQPNSQHACSAVHIPGRSKSYTAL